MRVLVVEDEALIAMDIAMTLEDEGHVVVGTARDADEALALAGEHLPDLVLMDLNLAGGTRGDAAARAILERHGIRSIFVSGSIDERMRAELLGLGPAGMLTKPVRPHELARAVAAAAAAADGAVVL